MDLENNQDNQEVSSSNHGGPRPGSGRPKGSYQKPQIRSYITDDQVAKMVEKAMDLANREKPDTFLLKFLLEQVFGKAKQAIDIEGDGSGFFSTRKLIIKVVKPGVDLGDTGDVKSENDIEEMPSVQ